MKTLSERLSKAELGYYGRNTYTGDIRADEFLFDLRGKKAIRKFQEMRDNNATIGAIMYATEQVLRDVEIKVVPADESEEARKEADFVQSVLDDMDHTLDDHISEALSFLTYGFAYFEVVYKRREGDVRSGKKHSKFTDGRIGVKKIAIRAPWTVDSFEVDLKTGDILGMHQDSGWGRGAVFIPIEKALYYRTTSLNNDPSGRSILRNAYSAYTFLSNLQSIEAIAIERELHGVPVGRMPAEYLSADAGEDQAALREQFERILRDLKKNEQGYALLPSDLYIDADGKPTSERLMDIELITSNGTRSIDIDPVIKRYQHDIARSVMAEFLMLGGGSTGSYALSKSKTDLFLRSMESYINSIVDVLNKQLIERLWQLNGLNVDLMPKLVAGDVAPHDLKEVASFIRNLNGADIPVAKHPEVVEELIRMLEVDFDREAYEARLATDEQRANQAYEAQQQALTAQQDNPPEQTEEVPNV